MACRRGHALADRRDRNGATRQRPRLPPRWPTAAATLGRSAPPRILLRRPREQYLALVRPRPALDRRVLAHAQPQLTPDLAAFHVITSTTPSTTPSTPTTRHHVTPRLPTPDASAAEQQRLLPERPRVLPAPSRQRPLLLHHLRHPESLPPARRRPRRAAAAPATALVLVVTSPLYTATRRHLLRSRCRATITVQATLISLPPSFCPDRRQKARLRGGADLLDFRGAPLS